MVAPARPSPTESTEFKDPNMMMNNTLVQLRELKLVGMATAVEEQLSSTASTTLSFEERLALMVDREVHQRATPRCSSGRG
jgi:IstB-like ATP binding protein